MADEASGIRYREELGAWWPDYDHAPEKCKAFVDNGLPAIDRAMKYARARQVAIQAGGHAGFWPKRLAELFDQVHTFEPEPLLYECMARNCTAPNVTMYRHGLGAMPGTVSFKSHVSAGSWRVDPAGEHRITIVSIDTLRLSHVDAIFLDIEGYEVEALSGAEVTIACWSPVILCELLPRSSAQICDWLRRRGYLQVDRFGRDGIFSRKF